MKKSKQRLFIPIALALAVMGFNIDGSRWPGGRTTFSVNIPGASPSGITWNQAFEDAMAQWNEATAFTFFMDIHPLDPCAGFSRNEVTNGFGFPAGDGDLRNGADFSATVCGNDFGTGVLAITLILSRGGMLGFSDLVETDVLFNAGARWDIFSGPLRLEADFGRVALHELGHALGLNHEDLRPAIMASRVTDLDTLQQDDIDGANALYGGPGDCSIPDISASAVVDEQLGVGDCKVFELFNGGTDTSFVDTYSLSLATETTVSIAMESSELDSVLVLMDAELNGIDFNDDSLGTCDARLSRTLPTGEYLILANTFDTPFKCGGNTGSYRLTITDNGKPLLTRSTSLLSGGSGAVFTGGATTDGGQTYRGVFDPDEVFSIEAEILVAPEHVGRAGQIFVVAVLGDDRRFAKTRTGGFEKLEGGLADLPAHRITALLRKQEPLAVANNISGEQLGLQHSTISVFVGYSLIGNPENIFFNGEPIRVFIDRGNPE